MKRGFLTTERAKRTLDKEYPTKRQALSTLPGDEAQSTSTPVAADVSKRPIDSDDAVLVTDRDKKAPDSDSDVDMLIPPVTATKNERTTSEKNNDDQPPITDAKSEQAANGKDAEPATTDNNRDDDGSAHNSGVYRINSEADLHTVPSIALHGKKKRAVFRVWPRDPNGRVMVPSQTLLQGGKVAPNGILSWGATLYDFYSFQPVPIIPNAITYLSGSRIAAAVRQIGELEYAKDELEWADNEDDPREIPVANTGELVECCEARARFFTAYSAAETRAEPTYGISSVLMFDRPLSSPFNPSHYPAPWPFIPFANPSPPVLLQERIPVHLLPQTLYVHDPYSLLRVDLDRNTNNDKTPWISMRPRVYLYKLHLGSSALKAVEESRKPAEESERKKKRTLDVYRFLPTEEERARGEPPYEVALPTKPSALTCVEEAHLYLSPAGELGEGNHSIVYRAEWELPRELFVEPRLCHSCVYEQLMEEVRKLKRPGQWHKMMQRAGCKVPLAAEEEGGTEEVDYEMPVPPDTHEEFDTERVILLKSQSDSRQKQVASSSISSSEEVTVFRVYCPNLRWQTPADPSTCCSHSIFRTHCPVPRTSVFQVAAKLSIQHDAHLAREAQNYQAFPQHFFQHWNGYNLIRPIHNPVPLHAVVPQFYGYYIPVEEVASSTSGKSTVDIGKEKTTAETAADTMHTDEIPGENASQSQPPPYLSLILLLEHCGQPVHLSSLSEDDREECASLCLRFNQAGWLHGSIALRNVLVQPGLPTQWPIERQFSQSDPETQKSFRLIDFGRSRKISNVSEWEALRLGRGETEEAMKLVNILHGKFL